MTSCSQLLDDLCPYRSSRASDEDHAVLPFSYCVRDWVTVSGYLPFPAGTRILKHCRRGVRPPPTAGRPPVEFKESDNSCRTRGQGPVIALLFEGTTAKETLQGRWPLPYAPSILQREEPDIVSRALTPGIPGEP